MNKAVELDPENPDILVARAEVLLGDGNDYGTLKFPEQATADLLKAIKLAPKRIDIMYRIVWSSSRTDIPTALNYIQKICAIDSSNAYPQILQTSILLSRTKFGTFARTLNAILALKAPAQYDHDGLINSVNSDDNIVSEITAALNSIQLITSLQDGASCVIPYVNSSMPRTLQPVQEICEWIRTSAIVTIESSREIHDFAYNVLTLSDLLAKRSETEQAFKVVSALDFCSQILHGSRWSNGLYKFRQEYARIMTSIMYFASIHSQYETLYRLVGNETLANKFHDTRRDYLKLFSEESHLFFGLIVDF